jgi:oligoendopeptidase F
VGETASSFAELLVVDALQSNAADQGANFASGWDDCSRAIGFLMNIPARFRFEVDLHERRKDGPLSTAGVTELMKNQLSVAYGPLLTGVDETFWASKLHFYITETSFYNYPYTFGYLFSAGIHATQSELGDAFYPSYVALLRDTGRMTAENLASKHLKVDIRDGAFWRSSLRGVAARVDAFEATLDALGM